LEKCTTACLEKNTTDQHKVTIEEETEEIGESRPSYANKLPSPFDPQPTSKAYIEDARIELKQMGYKSHDVDVFCDQFSYLFDSKNNIIEGFTKSYGLYPGIFDSPENIAKSKREINKLMKIFGMPKDYSSYDRPQKLGTTNKGEEKTYTPAKYVEEDVEKSVKVVEEKIEQPTKSEGKEQKLAKSQLTNIKEKPDPRKLLAQMNNEQRLECNKLYIEGFSMEEVIPIYVACDYEYETTLKVLQIQ